MRPLLIATALSFSCAALGAPSLVVEAIDVGASPVPNRPVRSPARAAAKKLMAQRCALCHGKSGAADGPMSRSLNPRPRAFTDPRWQASVKDAHIARIIVGGGSVVGKSPIMPANPDLEGEDAVVKALVELVRGFSSRGVVRFEAVDAEGKVVAKTAQPPSPTGATSTATLELAPGSYTLRAYYDADEDGARDDDERRAETSIEVTGPGGDATLSLAPPDAGPTTTSAPTAPAAPPP